GARELATKVVEVLKSTPAHYHGLYPDSLTLKEKIAAVAREIYGADGVEYTPQAEKQLADLEKRGYGRLPVCIAKTQYSLSDKPELKGAPKGWYLSVREVGLSAGAGFVVPICGSVMLMPGLSREPAALRMDLLDDGRIVGLK
ncbi:MAG: formate--tetrahydrofolate ligase, partial [Methanomethylophilus sp.]